MGVSINTGYIVWYNGPYPAGMMPDTKIYFRNLRWMLDPSEKIVSDKGYIRDYSMSLLLLRQQMRSIKNRWHLQGYDMRQ